MAKILFCVGLIVFIVRVSQQQSRENQLETFKIAQQVDRLLTTIKKLVDAADDLLVQAKQAYDQSKVKSVSPFVSALNATVKPYEDAVKEVLPLANNTAANICVAKAQATVRQLVAEGAKEAYSCTLEASLNLNKFATQVASQDIGPTSRFSAAAYDAVSKCPLIFSIDRLNLEDLNNAKVCYTQAAAQLTQYVNKTSTDLVELRVNLKALQDNVTACLSNSSEVVVRGAQTALDVMVSCGSAANTWLLPANVIEAINTGASEMDDFILDVNSVITTAFMAVNETIVSLDSINASVTTEIQQALVKTSELIDFVAEFLQSSNDHYELTCLNDARTSYDEILKSDSNYAITCIAAAKKTLDVSSLIQEEARLKALLVNATAEAVSRCTNNPPLTEESVTKCLLNARIQLENLVWANIENTGSVIVMAETVFATAERCLDTETHHASQRGKKAVQVLSECLLELGIEFTFDKS